MNKDINQKISQFLDGELDHAAIDSLLLEIKKNPELKNKINRYQMMTQALSPEQGIDIRVDFLTNIKQQIESEPHYLLPKQATNKRTVGFWQKTSFAVAASVACVAVVISQQSGVQINKMPQQLASVEVQSIEQPVQVVADNKQPSQHERLKAYLQAHNDDLYTHGSAYIHPLASTVSYGRE